jgi:Carbohydrate esterase, sialic acid-specific acetylesterase
MKTSLITLLFLLFSVSGFAQKLDGTWKGMLSGPNGDMNLTFTFKVKADTLSGNVSSEMGTLPLENGKVNGNKFSFDVNVNGQTIHHTGILDSGTVELKLPMMDQPMVLNKVKQESKIDGTWVGMVSGPQGDMKLIFSFKVDGDTLTGTDSSSLGVINLTNGVVNGNEFSFDVDLNGMSISHNCKYIAGDTIKVLADVMNQKVKMNLTRLDTTVYTRDPNFYIFICFGQSNMEGFPGIIPEDTVKVNKRFQVLAAVDFPKLGRKKGQWYTAVPPLCRPSTGLCPADYFGRTMVDNLPKDIKIGVVNVAVAGCKIELFEKDKYQAYDSTAPSWMKNIIEQYDGNPYQYLVNMAKLAQKSGVIKGILLHQGESNTGDEDWPEKVKGIYNNLIKDLNLNPENVPLLAGEVVNADENGACASMNKIIDKLPQTVPNSYVISSASCPAREPDHLHFTPEGYRIFGTRYAEKMLSLLGYKVTKTELKQTQTENK